MKYNVGDKVRIKSLDWYNENKNHCGEIPLFKPSGLFVPDMSRYCNNIMTIKDICYGTCYRMKEDFWNYNWTDEMIEGLVEEETKFGTASNPIEIKSNANCITRERVDEMSLDKAGQITDFEYEGLAYTLPEGYQFVDENGNIINATKIVLEKKKKEYPKTYEECYKIMDIDTGFLLTSYDLDFWKGHLLTSLQKLLICRNAYWKLAGWKPEYPFNAARYVISNAMGNVSGCIIYDMTRNCILEFPTEEMRDAFYGNFKDLIEGCKELL